MTRPPGYPGRPDYGDDPYGQPRYGGDPYGQPGTSDPYGGYQGGHRDPYGQPESPPPQDPYGGWGQPPPSGPRHSEPSHGQPSHGEPGYDQPRYGEPSYGQPRHGQPGYGEPSYGQPRHGQPGYGQSPTGPDHGGYGGQGGYGQPPDPGYQQPPGPGYGTPPPAPRSRFGLVLGIIGGLVALLLVAGAGYVLLGNGADDPGRKAATSPSVDPDLAEPGKVVDGWLNAMFILKDPDAMLKFTCKREADRDEVDDAIKTVKDAEQDAKDAKLSMKVTWSEPEVTSDDGKAAKVTSTLKVVVGDKTEEKPASFDLVFEAGWKVCDAEMP